MWSYSSPTTPTRTVPLLSSRVSIPPDDVTRRRVWGPVVIAAVCCLSACGSTTAAKVNSSPRSAIVTPSPLDPAVVAFRKVVTQAHGALQQSEASYDMFCRQPLNVTECRVSQVDSIAADIAALGILATATVPASLAAKNQALHDGLVQDQANGKAAVAAIDTGNTDAMKAAIKAAADYYVNNVYALLNELQGS